VSVFLPPALPCCSELRAIKRLFVSLYSLKCSIQLLPLGCSKTVVESAKCTESIILNVIVGLHFINILVGRSSPYCEDVEEILLLNKFFPIVDMCLSCEDIARQSCAMVPRWQFLATFLGPAFAASCVQHISDLHSKFALGPHHV